MVATDIGERLKDLRRVMGWKQPDFAEVVWRETNAISEWETGKRPPPANVLARLCRKYGWPPAIFEKDGPMPSTLVNRPTAAPSPPEAGTVGAGGARRVYAALMKDLAEAAAEGRSLPPSEVIDLLTRLWRAVTAEVPGLAVATPLRAGAFDAIRRELFEQGKGDERNQA